MLFVILQEDPSGGWENEKITKALFEEMISDLHGSCRKAAEVSNTSHKCKHCDNKSECINRISLFLSEIAVCLRISAVHYPRWQNRKIAIVLRGLHCNINAILLQ